MSKLRKLAKLKKPAPLPSKAEKPKSEAVQASEELFKAAMAKAKRGDQFDNKGLSGGQISQLTKVWYDAYRKQVEAGEREPTMPHSKEAEKCADCGFLAGYYEIDGKEALITPSVICSSGKRRWLCPNCLHKEFGAKITTSYGPRVKTLTGEAVIQVAKRGLPKKRSK